MLLAFVTFFDGWGEWGPCGPGTLLGQLGLMLHTAPGLWVGATAEWLGMTSRVSWIPVVVSQWLAWIAFLRLTLRPKIPKTL